MAPTIMNNFTTVSTVTPAVKPAMVMPQMSASAVHRVNYLVRMGHVWNAVASIVV